MAILCNCNMGCKKKYPDADASVLGSNEENLKKYEENWRKFLGGITENR